MSLPTADIDFLRGLVAEHSGNVIAPRQVYMLTQRLDPVARGVGLDNVEQLVDELRRARNPQLSDKVAEAVTVNETSFFRDMHLFEALRTKLLPDLARARQDTKRIRIWCAACSSGQEPYSIAMTIHEQFKRLDEWDIRILATDLSEQMLAKSRAGEYSQLEVNRGLPARKLVQYFNRKGQIWQVRPELRSLVNHRRLNLTQAWPYLGHFDLVFIRNVLIYFDQKTKADILQRIGSVVAPGGNVFIGSAETIIGLGVPFERQEINGTVCYQPNGK